MSEWYIRLYNWFHKFRMRKQRKVLNELRDTDVSSLNSLDKLLPILKQQLDLLSDRDLQQIQGNDIYTIKVPVFFLQYDFFREWLKSSITKVSVLGNVEGKGYIDLDKTVTGYHTSATDMRISKWVPWQVIEETGIRLDLFYAIVRTDLAAMEKVMLTVTDPYFKNYYDQRFASALQDVLLVVYTINEMVAFYEWRR